MAIGLAEGAPIGVTEEAGKVAGSAVDAMRASPIALALLVINAMFLGLIAYILGEVSGNEGDRAKIEADLITKLVTDIRDCRAGAKPTKFDFLSYPPSDIQMPWPPDCVRSTINHGCVP